jgi:hypothetical protein
MVAKGPTGLSSAYAKNNGVHEGDCLSPTLFCLVLNMYFMWLRALNIGYEMKSAKESSLETSIKILVNGYADDMALLDTSHQEVSQILGMLERFLVYYGMELNASKCGYQYLIHQLDTCTPTITCRWGDIPNYHDYKSYKYFGYYVNTKLDFRYQYEAMITKMTEACKQFCNR